MGLLNRLGFLNWCGSFTGLARQDDLVGFILGWTTYCESCSTHRTTSEVLDMAFSKMDPKKKQGYIDQLKCVTPKPSQVVKDWFSGPLEPMATEGIAFFESKPVRSRQKMSSWRRSRLKGERPLLKRSRFGWFRWEMLVIFESQFGGRWFSSCFASSSCSGTFGSATKALARHCTATAEAVAVWRLWEWRPSTAISVAWSSTHNWQVHDPNPICGKQNATICHISIHFSNIWILWCAHLQLPRCGSCKTVRYCSPECQKGHWKEHKKTCRRRLSETQQPEEKTTRRLSL